MTSLWQAWKQERQNIREWMEFSNLLESYEDLLNEHYYGDDCMCSPDTDSCPVCGDMRVDGVCPWENYSDESLMQAMDIDATGGGVAWAEAVLTHYHEAEYEKRCAELERNSVESYYRNREQTMLNHLRVDA